MYRITKKFKFEYAHILDLDYESPCTNIHGHSAIVKVSIYSKELDKNGMVIDFKDLSFINDYLQNNYDHKLIIPKSLRSSFNFLQFESSTIIIDKNTTAENFSDIFLKDIGYTLISNGIKFEKLAVEFFETSNNSARSVIKYKDLLLLKKEIEDEELKDMESDKSNIYLTLTKSGANFLVSTQKISDLSVEKQKEYKLISFLDDDYVIIPQDEGIDSILDYINEQYQNYLGFEDDEFQEFTKETLFSCLMNDYISFSIVIWEDEIDNSEK